MTAFTSTSDLFVSSTSNDPPVPGALFPATTFVSSVVVSASFTLSNNAISASYVLFKPLAVTSNFATVAMSLPPKALVYFA